MGRVPTNDDYVTMVATWFSFSIIASVLGIAAMRSRDAR